MQYTPEQREMISAESQGKTVKDDAGGYWVMAFTDDTELCFRFMSELVASHG